MTEKYEVEIGDGVNVDKYGDGGADDGDDNGTPPLNPNLQEATPSLLSANTGAHGMYISAPGPCALRGMFIGPVPDPGKGGIGLLGAPLPGFTFTTWRQNGLPEV